MERGRGRSKQASVLIWALAATLLSQNLVNNIAGLRFGIPIAGHGSPPYGSGGSYGGTPPSHHGTPSHGGGTSHGTPPANCGNPPSGHHNPSPSTPTGGSPPTGGSYSPPTYTPTPSVPTPSTPYTPTPTPSIPTPSTPTIISPPTTPIDPGTPTIPGISIPSPPLLPGYPPIGGTGGTCDFWRTHPGYIWGLFGWWGTTVGGALGVSSIPGFGSNLSLQQALSNTRSDGFGALYREGTASLLNSMVNNRFPFTTNQVRDNFVSALGSNKAAAAQARVFKQANEGRLKPRA
ncbi:hypothetical protein RJ639_000165 [Escallonia herrerae]|uniref:Protodermal factor 1 n=1 Tax=Escallonia herrerae TaxID=1293975 RepID=A0AA88X9C4_9ASTE|nr:hypothetical protein RJ639_000165 [Escallonia herrerae]